jgi:flavin reductase (DIM6/NTAB) family NADH-FMN oxidoreductase RutF
LTINPANLSPQQVYAYLSTAVAPRPICFASTVDAAGNVNLSPYSFFNVVSGDPPMLAFAPQLSGRDGSSKDTLNNVLAVPEVVINIVSYDMAEQMSLTSTSYPPGVNEFEKAALTQLQSEVVKPPRVGEAKVAFECIVDRVIALGDGPMAGSLVLARVVRIHLHDEIAKPDGTIDPHKLDLIGRMGGSDYIRAIPAALFEIPKPIRTLGIGVDALPEHVRNSSVLTGNDLGRLGNAERLPSAEEIAHAHAVPATKIAQQSGLPALHQLAKQQLASGNTADALAILLLPQ